MTGGEAVGRAQVDGGSDRARQEADMDGDRGAQARRGDGQAAARRRGRFGALVRAQIAVLEVVNLLANGAASGDWSVLIGLILPILWFSCAYCGVRDRSLWLVRTFNNCAIFCGVIGLLFVGLTWWVVDFLRAVCANTERVSRATRDARANCDGKHVKESVVTAAIVTTVFGVTIAVLQFLGSCFGRSLVDRGAAYFAGTPLPAAGGSIVGAPTYYASQPPPGVIVGAPVWGGGAYASGLPPGGVVYGTAPPPQPGAYSAAAFPPRAAPAYPPPGVYGYAAPRPVPSSSNAPPAGKDTPL
jgi:hypothetical protein